MRRLFQKLLADALLPMASKEDRIEIALELARQQKDHRLPEFRHREELSDWDKRFLGSQGLYNEWWNAELDAQREMSDLHPNVECHPILYGMVNFVDPFEFARRRA